MGRSLAEIQAEISKLKKEADKIRSVEVKEVVGKIRKAIAHYGLTPQELFGKGVGASVKAGSGKAKGAAAKKGRVAKAGKGKAKSAAKAPAEPLKAGASYVVEVAAGNVRGATIFQARGSDE